MTLLPLLSQASRQLFWYAVFTRPGPACGSADTLSHVGAAFEGRHWALWDQLGSFEVSSVRVAEQKTTQEGSFAC